MMHGTRAATAGCGSLARSYRPRSQVLVIEKLNELAGRHPYDLDNRRSGRRRVTPGARWASMGSPTSASASRTATSGIALAHASQHQPADFSPSLTQPGRSRAGDQPPRARLASQRRGREGLLISIGLRPQPDGEAEALRLARRPMAIPNAGPEAACFSGRIRVR